MSKPLSVLLDTNVWLDLYDADRAHAEESQKLVTALRKADADFYYTATSMKDVFFLMTNSLKRKTRNDCGRLTEKDALAINEIAWGCIRNMYETAAPIPVPGPVLFQAIRMKDIYPDFEDDVILAAAKLAGVDYLVTNDEGLVARAYVPTLTASTMLAYLEIYDL